MSIHPLNPQGSVDSLSSSNLNESSEQKAYHKPYTISKDSMSSAANDDLYNLDINIKRGNHPLGKQATAGYTTEYTPTYTCTCETCDLTCNTCLQTLCC
ncbi:MAG: hypothetical protein H0W88_04440 [Parachlamydiaceae bacterium]|nr:hypothetical protein [Parachlamydiaceae bacterium]